jgi:predicted glycosyl hydrolase (DUF1957 family)
MSNTNMSLLVVLANLTGRQYINNVLHLLEHNEPLELGGMMDAALKQAGDDFEEWEAVPEAANYRGVNDHWTQDDEDEAAKIMKKAVDDFIELITSEAPESIELRKTFYSAVQKRITKSCITLKDRVWDG